MGHRIRVGAVNYLNTKPLVEGLTGFAPAIDLAFDLPSRLADRMAVGDLDVGLIPVVELFRAGTYSVVPDVAIASRGPVLSVTLFCRVPWAEIRSVALDEGSRTSSALAQILLRKRYGIRPTIEQLPIDAPADDLHTDAVLLIGDRAMRACLPGFGFAYDLGQEWADWTGLPFVYAAWAVRGGVDLRGAEAAFLKAKQYGVSRAGLIAAREAPLLGLDPGYCRRYLSHIIHYDLGPRELAGLTRYHELAAELGLAPPGVSVVRYHRPHLVESR
jgi:chorismate dehydratase